MAKNLTRNMHIPSIAGLFWQSSKRMGMALTLRNFWKYGDFRVGEFIGFDKFGNAYFEGMTWIGPKRWVEYKNYWYDASEVPPEWHAWLHYTTDKNGEDIERAGEKYRLPHKPNGTADAPYSPHNFLLNADYGRKNKKMEEWKWVGDGK